MRAVLYLSGVLLLMTLTQAEGPVNLACTSLAEVSPSSAVYYEK